MIRVESLSKRYKKIEAVKNVSFQANDGEITGLLGENGAGKSTTIRMISGAILPDEGAVYLNDKKLRYGDFLGRRSLGVLTDARGLYEKLTTRENIELYGRLYGLNGIQLEREVDRVIDLLDIKDIAKRRTLGFSTGQKMKVALGRVLVNSPKNLILDEPTSGLDVLSTRNLRQVLAQLRDEGCCILLSTHIMQEIDQLCDDVVIIDGGKVLVQGAKSELVASTKSSSIEDCFVNYIQKGESREL